MWVAVAVVVPCLALFAGTIWLVLTRRLSSLRPADAPGGDPVGLVLLTLVAAGGTVVLDRVTHGACHGWLTALPAVLLALFLVRWTPAFRRRRRRPTEAVFPGAVVRRWTYPTRNEERASTRYCCSIDDGDSETSWSFVVDRALWDQVRVGDAVEVRWNPRQHLLLSVTPLVPQPLAAEPSAAEPSVHGPTDTV